MVRVDLEAVIRRVEAALRDFPQVAGAYLFGSALDACRPDSDLDLGLILEPEIKPESMEGGRLEAAIAFFLPPVEGHSFDLVLLNPDKPLFVFSTLKAEHLRKMEN